jgi:Mlc titration factor MtfA (ptsG expression regulator)
VAVGCRGAALPRRAHDDEQLRLRALAEDFLAEKEFTAAGGLELSDAICVSIAAQGCLPILELGLDYYRGWVGVIVYADEFIIPRSVEDEFGVVHEYQELASGEAWEGGPLLISWRDAQMAGSRLQRRHPRVRAQARHAQWRSRTASRRCRRKSASPTGSRCSKPVTTTSAAGRRS